MLEPPEQYRRYWRFRVEKEMWLRKLMEHVLADLRAGTDPADRVLAKWSRPGVEIRLHSQAEPVDQYGAEGIPELGGPSCPLRFQLNRFPSGQEGTWHSEVIQRTARMSVLPERGWVVFRVNRIVPEAVPPLADVRDKVVGEILDARAREQARARLEGLRKAAGDARVALSAAAKDQGLESAVAGPFNAFSWRPPLPLPAAGEPAPPRADGWKDPDRRISAIMGRYQALRETPAGSFSAALDDVDGTGAFYIAQVKGRTEPRFEEMTLAQATQVRRTILRERMGAALQELTYSRLKDRLALHVGGRPAEEPKGRGGE
jgi:hypothetical protein